MGFSLFGRKKVSPLETLYTIINLAAKAKNLTEIWDPLLAEVLKIMKVDAGTIMILEGDFLIRKAARGLDPKIMDEPPIHRNRGGISWSVVQSQKPVVYSDLSNVQIASKVVSRGDLVSLVTVPMITRNQVVGVASIFTRTARKFSNADLALFQTIANQAAVAIISIQNIQLLEENQKRLRQLSAINEISKSISTLFDFEETIYSMIGVLSSLFKADICFIALYDKKSDYLLGLKPAFGLDEGTVNNFRIKSDEGISGKAFCGGLPVLIQDTEKIISLPNIKGIKSLMAAPLKVKSQTLGVIHIASRQPNKFSQDDSNLFGILSGEAALVVNTSFLYHLIQQTKDKNEAILISIGEGVLATDFDGRIILFNQAAQKITGFAPQEVIDKPFEDIVKIITEDKKSIKVNPVKSVIETQKPFALAGFNYLKRKNGELIPISFSASVIFDWQKKVIGAIATFKDLSKEYELEQMKKELLSIATHELRSPITVMKGYLDMVMAGEAGKISRKVADLLSEAADNNDRLALLVDDLLDVSRIEQGRIQVNLTKIDLEPAIEEIINQFALEARKKKIKLIFEPPTQKLPAVSADPDRVKQILANLISNGLKYTPKGEVKVKVETNEQIKIWVIDTGLGIAETQISHLFQKFYRIRNQKTKEITGTGLGLYICRKLVEMMHGEIGVKSREGQGSSFWFTLKKA